MLTWLNEGGPFMYVILGVSIVSVTLILERAFVLFLRYRINADQLMSQILGFVEEKKYSRAIEVCNVKGYHPLAEVLKAGLTKANESDKDIQRALETASMKVTPKVSQRVGYLSMLANVSTLLGLLGTIQGLVDSFRGVASADAATKQDILAKGIAVAMNTTAFGLIAAIPAIIGFTFLATRQNSILETIEIKATELFNYLSERNRKLVSRG